MCIEDYAIASAIVFQQSSQVLTLGSNAYPLVPARRNRVGVIVSNMGPDDLVVYASDSPALTFGKAFADEPAQLFHILQYGTLIQGALFCEIVTLTTGLTVDVTELLLPHNLYGKVTEHLLSMGVK